jgi:hypothetical protein
MGETRAYETMHIGLICMTLTYVHQSYCCALFYCSCITRLRKQCPT